VHSGRLTDTKERIVVALSGYGAALLLLLLTAVVNHDGHADRHLIESALICGGATTGILLRSIGARDD
jgi:hypothetical protein